MDIDPNSSDAGAKAFAAAGMGMPGRSVESDERMAYFRTQQHRPGVANLPVSGAAPVTGGTGRGNSEGFAIPNPGREPTIVPPSQAPQRTVQTNAPLGPAIGARSMFN